MNRIPFLETPRLLLYDVDEFHCNETYLSWLHDKEISVYLESGRYPTSIDKLKEFLLSVHKQEVLFLAIHIKKTGKHIGNIKIDSINRMHQIAEYGIMIGDKEAWGKGYGKEATEVVLDHCFKKLNLRKITLGVLSNNIGAVKLYKNKLGFVEEGKYIKHVFCNGDYVDILRMAKFR